MKVVGTEARIPSSSSAVMLVQVTTERQVTQKPLFGPEHHQHLNATLSLYSDTNQLSGDDWQSQGSPGALAAQVG